MVPLPLPLPLGLNPLSREALESLIGASLAILDSSSSALLSICFNWFVQTLGSRTDPKSITNLKQINQPCKYGFDFVFCHCWLTFRSNNQTLEASKSSNTNCFVLGFSIFNRFQIMQIWLPILLQFWIRFNINNKLTSLPKAIRIGIHFSINSGFAFVQISAPFRDPCWNTSGQLLPPKTAEGSKVVAMLLRLPVFFSFQTYLNTLAALLPSTIAARLLS